MLNMMNYTVLTIQNLGGFGNSTRYIEDDMTIQKMGTLILYVLILISPFLLCYVLCGQSTKCKYNRSP